MCNYFVRFGMVTVRGETRSILFTCTFPLNSQDFGEPQFLVQLFAELKVGYERENVEN